MRGDIRDKKFPGVLLKAGLCLIFLATILLASPGAADQKNKGPMPLSPRDFVEQNLAKTRKRLAELSRNYAGECGSLLSALSPGDPVKIAEGLPKPGRLRYFLRYPEPEWKDLIKAPPKGILSANKVFATRLSASPVIYRNGGYASLIRPWPSWRWPFRVAADELTAAALNLPRTVGLSLRATVAYTGKPEEDRRCCAKKKPYTYYIYVKGKKKARKGYRCGSYQSYVPIHYHYSRYRRYRRYPSSCDPRGIPKLKLTIKGDVESIENGAAIRFSSPGRKKVTFSLPRYKYPDSIASTRSCVPEFSNKKEVAKSYKAAGTVEESLLFDVRKFIKIGFPGLDFETEDKKPPVFDYFFSRERPAHGYLNIKEIASSDRTLLPRLLVEYDDGRGLKQHSHRPSDFRAYVRCMATRPGPISIDNKGRLTHLGGAGETEIGWFLGNNLAEVRKKVTANEVTVKLDSCLEDKLGAARGKYPVKIQIKGGADMKAFQAGWSGQAKWEKATTSFSKKDDGCWVTENVVTLPDKGWKKILESQKRPKKTEKQVRITVMVTNKTASRDVFYYETEINVGPPSPISLELLTARGDEKPDLLSFVDLFTPNQLAKMNRLGFFSRVKLEGETEKRDLDKIGHIVKMELVSSNPLIFQVSGGKGEIGYHVSGSAEITARIGGADLDAKNRLEIQEGKSLKSGPVLVNVNRLILSKEKISGERPEYYRLMVTGPSDMSSYKAVWVGKHIKNKTGFKKTADGYVAEFKTGLLLRSVEISDGKRTLARLLPEMAVPRARIRLAPRQAPITTIGVSPLPDSGMLGTLTECRKQIKACVELFGFDTEGKSVREYCREDRIKDKADIQKKREWLKKQNKVVKNLARQGEELVILADSMTVGAAITGLDREFWNCAVCRWSLSGGGSLKLKSRITPVYMVSENAGGSFNTVSGIKKGFNPGAYIKVELIINPDSKGIPCFTTGKRSVSYPGKELFR